MERTDQVKGGREKANERLNAYDSIIIISYRALHVCFKILGQAENLCNWKLVLISHSHKFSTAAVHYLSKERKRKLCVRLFERIGKKKRGQIMKKINGHTSIQYFSEH